MMGRRMRCLLAWIGDRERGSMRRACAALAVRGVRRCQNLMAAKRPASLPDDRFR